MELAEYCYYFSLIRNLLDRGITMEKKVYKLGVAKIGSVFIRGFLLVNGRIHEWLVNTFLSCSWKLIYAIENDIC